MKKTRPNRSHTKRKLRKTRCCLLPELNRCHGVVRRQESERNLNKDLNQLLMDWSLNLQHSSNYPEASPRNSKKNSRPMVLNL